MNLESVCRKQALTVPTTGFRGEGACQENSCVLGGLLHQGMQVASTLSKKPTFLYTTSGKYIS